MSIVLGPHTIFVLRAASKQSDYGTKQVLDWSNATSTEVSGCSVQPAPAPEYTNDRSAVMTQWVAWVPPDADVQAIDRIVFAGDTYDVDGEVMRWHFGALAHQQINLRRSRDEAV